MAQRSDASGTVLSNHLLDSHGTVKSGTLSEPFGYKAQFGYYTDLETWLQLLTHRYYDPNTGRFLTWDPIGYAGGINLYSYVTNEPVRLIDPEGTQIRSDRNFRRGPAQPSNPKPKRPPDDVYRRALEKIASATGSSLDHKWGIHPGSKSYDRAINDLKNMGFRPFFNPNISHWGGTDWEGMIEVIGITSRLVVPAGCTGRDSG